MSPRIDIRHGRMKARSGVREFDIGGGNYRNDQWLPDQGAEALSADLPAAVLDAARPARLPAMLVEVCSAWPAPARCRLRLYDSRAASMTLRRTDA
ncbi:hypothetical protein [Promicromonospora sp. NPDC057488]|uniref:hypothetical protein n=1 Tax=Promicromonospora sp. NPDC057488 TaxID=3346147 RepID=UPI00366CFB05